MIFKKEDKKEEFPALTAHGKKQIDAPLWGIFQQKDLLVYTVFTIRLSLFFL